MAAPERYRFGEMALDVGERRLRRNGQIVALAPKTFDVLVHLVRNAGRLVTKQELLERVWTGSFVEEGILSVHVSGLRKALGDDRSSRAIETVARSGYRFTAPVVEDRAAAEGGSIAILPALSAGSGTTDAERSVGLAIADALIGRLGRLTRTSIRPARAVHAYADPARDPAAVGRSLKVDAVVACRFERTPDGMRVAAELLRSRDGLRLWSGAHDERPGDTVSLVDVLADELAAHLSAEPLDRTSAGVFGTWADLRRRVSRPPRRLEVYERLGRGRAHLLAFSRNDAPKAVAEYEAAIALDPTFAASHAGLAVAFCQQAELRLVPQSDAYAHARDAALRALAVDDACADAQVALASVSFFGQWDWVGAQRALERALEINPNHTEAYVLFGRLLDALGKLPEGLEMKMRALERDPFSPLVHHAISLSYWHQRRYEDSIDWAKRTLQLDPKHLVAREHLAAAYWGLGDFDRSMEESVRHAESFGLAAEALDPIKKAYARGGRTGLIRWLIETQGGGMPAIQLALFHGELGELDLAIESLVRAIDAHDPCLVDLAVAPQWDPLRASPRFRGCLERMGLAR